MLRRPDIPPEPDRSNREHGRAMLVVVALVLSLLAASWLSPIGALAGVLASLVIMLMGMVTGWFVTHVLKIPRDARGVHERTLIDREETAD